LTGLNAGYTRTRTENKKNQAKLLDYKNEFEYKCVRNPH